jgi:hypothetical protein
MVLLRYTCMGKLMLNQAVKWAILTELKIKFLISKKKPQD